MDSKNGDFVSLVSQDFTDLEINVSEEEIQEMSKYDWKKYVHEKLRLKAFKSLTEENLTKTKTNHIHFESFKMRNYLSHNVNSSLSKIIFSVWAGTLDLKSLHEWKYENAKCVMCNLDTENIEHFMMCKEYGIGILNIDWKEIYENNFENQNQVAKEVKRRLFLRKAKLDKVGLPDNMAPMLQDPVER